ncbi:hypothetical protein [Algihabitans sp.]|uniref:hypothetical protein n=1 Tax=Algihabitans sp. TaxID=2821514 RepID=UPI003BAB8659
MLDSPPAQQEDPTTVEFRSDGKPSFTNRALPSLVMSTSRPFDRTLAASGKRLLAASGLVFALGACDPTLLATGASVVTLVATDKTMTDHALSAALDRDCSFVRSSRGESFCVQEPYVMQTEHCYRTLGNVTCYSRPDPQASDAQRVTYAPDLVEPRPAIDLTGLDLSEVLGETEQAKEN